MYKIIAAFLVMLCTIACANTVQNKINSMSEKSRVEDSASQDKIRVKVDSIFTIPLKCNAGAGYSWQLADSSFAGYVKYLKQDFQNLSPEKDGGDGLQTFYFNALQAGKAQIKFIYVQPFKKPWPADAPQRGFSIIIY